MLIGINGGYFPAICRVCYIVDFLLRHLPLSCFRFVNWISWIISYHFDSNYMYYMVSCSFIFTKTQVLHGLFYFYKDPGFFAVAFFVIFEVFFIRSYTTFFSNVLLIFLLVFKVFKRFIPII